MRRTASLDALYLRPAPAWSLLTSTLLQLDKATQTDESYLERIRGSTWTPTGGPVSGLSADSSPIITRTEVTTPTDLKMEKVIRQRLQRTHRGEHSVSSQTLSPNHGRLNLLTTCRTVTSIYNFSSKFQLRQAQFPYLHVPVHLFTCDRCGTQ